MAIEILTSNGFKPFAGVRRSISKKLVRIRFEDSELICTLDHQLQTPRGFVAAKTLKPCDRVNPNSRVVSISQFKGDEYVYDPVEVAGGHHYISNKVVSHNCEFFGSSDTLISGSKLQQLTFVDPIQTDHTFNVYAEPEAEKNYVATIDVAEGIGKDYSVINVFDISTQPYRQVAIYRNNIIPPIMLVDVAHKILRLYNEAYCIIESNSVGKIVADGLYYDLEYDNMLTSRAKDGENIVSSSSEAVGLRQTKKTKLIGCSALKTMIESDTLLVSDFMTVQELSTFIKKLNTYQAEEGKTDDIAMTLVMFCWFTNQPYFEDLTDINVRNLIKSNYLKVEENNHLVFGFYDNGINEARDGVIEDLSLLKH